MRRPDQFSLRPISVGPSEVATLPFSRNRPDSEKNQPLVGAQIKLRVDPENEYNRNRSKQVNTDQNGHYLLKDLPPGKYKVTARISSPGEGAPAIKSDPVAVTLAEHEHRTVDIKLTFPKTE